MIALGTTAIFGATFATRSADAQEAAEIAKRLLEAASPLGDRSLG